MSKTKTIEEQIQYWKTLSEHLQRWRSEECLDRGNGPEEWEERLGEIISDCPEDEAWDFINKQLSPELLQAVFKWNEAVALVRQCCLGAEITLRQRLEKEGEK